MLRVADHKPEALQRCLNEVTKLTNEGVLKPNVGGEFPAAEIGKAHALLESRKSTGKIVVTW
jgi:NADPH:quinone reductase-like Zn-dependent oxidoreductase